MYKKQTLKNGLRVVTHSVKDRDSIALGIWIGVGGRYEDDRLKGVAHFLEHIVFKGSQKYICEEIKILIEGVGGALNAFTSEEQTCYYAKIPAKHLNQTFDVLADMVFYPKVMPKDVNKEKTVIVEEIKMYHDLPQYFIMDVLDGLVWPDHPLGKSLPGTQETVMGLSHKDLKAFHQKYYVPENIVIAASGNLSHEKILGLVQKKFGNLKGVYQGDYTQADNGQCQPRVQFCKKDIEQMHLAMGVPGYDENHCDRYALSLLSLILGGNMSSRLFVEVREKRGLAYSISSSYKAMHDTGLFLIRAGVDNTKIVEAVGLILKELTKIRRHGVDEGEFCRAKEYLSGQLLLGLEDTMEHMLWVGEGLISRGEVKTLQGILKEFAKIKKEDIQRVAKDILSPNRYNLAVVGPLNDHQDKALKDLMKF